MVARPCEFESHPAHMWRHLLWEVPLFCDVFIRNTSQTIVLKGIGCDALAQCLQ